MEIKTELENFGKEIKEDITKVNTELKSQLDALQGQFDQLSVKQLDLNAKTITFADELKSQLSASNGSFLGATFELKAALKPQSDINPEYRAGITGFANRKVNARQLFAVGSTSGDAVKYVKLSGYTNGAGIKQEGVKAGESTFGIKQETALVENISTFLVISKEMLNDVDGMVSFLNNQIPAKLAEAEDAALLFGTNEIKGVGTTAQAFSGTTVTLGTGSTVNEFDVLRVGVNMINIANYSATAILVHPSDATKLQLAKDTTGQYLFSQSNMSVAGVPIVESTAIAEGKFLIGDFRLGAELKERAGVTINYHYQDADNVQKGLVTIAVEERIALPVYHNGAFVSGDFVSAKAKLKS